MRAVDILSADWILRSLSATRSGGWDHLDIVEVGVDAQRQVAGQGPGRRRPGHQLSFVRIVIQNKGYLVHAAAQHVSGHGQKAG